MENITVTIKAVDLADLVRKVQAAKFDVDWRDRKIKELESEKQKLEQQLEQLKQKETEE